MSPPFNLLDRILYEDDALLVLDKPAGLLSQPTHDRSRAHVTSELERVLTERDGEPGYLAIHHRLDLPTSGVMVLARSREANTPLMNMFRQRVAKKTYFAITRAPTSSLPDVHSNHLAREKQKKGAAPMVPVRAGGDYAETSFDLLDTCSQLALIAAYPHTGRRHQIRAHLAELGAPLLGDTLYGGPARWQKVAVERVLLHARAITFPHPLDQRWLTIKAPLPPDFSSWLERIGLVCPD